MATYQVGSNTYSVPLSLFADNRKRLVAELKKVPNLPSNAVVFMAGGPDVTRFDSDHEPLFRQESYFLWAFGVREPDFYGMIHVESGKCVLVSPLLPPEYAVIMGAIRSKEEIRDLYQVDEVVHHNEAADAIKSLAGDDATLLIMDGLNTDSKKRTVPINYGPVPGVEDFKKDTEILHPIICDCRVFKSQAEIDVMKYMNKIASDAHKEVMKTAKPGIGEYQLESVFRHYCYFNGGARNLAYTCIAASGPNSAVLHYGHAGAPNDRTLQEDDMVLCDLGAEYYGYASDITCTFPASGKFSEKQKVIYNAVLKSHQTVLSQVKAGIYYKDMHRLADRIHCEELKKAGLLKGDIDEMMKNFVGSLFMPHGLGHLIGIDTHDVGGYPKGTVRSAEPGLRSLRVERVLEAGMVITVEPGIYFIDALLEPAFKDEKLAPFLNEEKIREYQGFGGVRIEDNVLLHEDRAESFTQVPRTVEEIEAWMSS